MYIQGWFYLSNEDYFCNFKSKIFEIARKNFKISCASILMVFGAAVFEEGKSLISTIMFYYSARDSSCRLSYIIICIIIFLAVSFIFNIILIFKFCSIFYFKQIAKFSFCGADVTLNFDWQYLYCTLF